MSNKKTTILIVDDEPLVLNSLSGLMMELGYSVISCRNGHEAISKVIENKIDVVLTDIKMPETINTSLAQVLPDSLMEFILYCLTWIIKLLFGR